MARQYTFILVCIFSLSFISLWTMRLKSSTPKTVHSILESTFRSPAEALEDSPRRELVKTLDAGLQVESIESDTEAKNSSASNNYPGIQIPASALTLLEIEPLSARPFSLGLARAR